MDSARSHLLCCGVGGPYPARVWSPGHVYDRKNDTIIDNECLQLVYDGTDSNCHREKLYMIAIASQLAVCITKASLILDDFYDLTQEIHSPSVLHLWNAPAINYCPHYLSVCLILWSIVLVAQSPNRLASHSCYWCQKISMQQGPLLKLRTSILFNGHFTWHQRQCGLQFTGPAHMHSCILCMHSNVITI